MIKKIGILSALFAIAGILSSPSSSASQPGARKCVTQTDSYTLSRVDPEFTGVVSQFNDYFSSRIDTEASLQISRGYSQLIPVKAETVTIEVDRSTCGAGAPGSQSGIASIGGCDYVGCTGSLPGEFDSLPTGSTISMSSCGGGVQTSGSFVRQSDGTWVMSSYREEMVTSCPPG